MNTADDVDLSRFLTPYRPSLPPRETGHAGEPTGPNPLLPHPGDRGVPSRSGAIWVWAAMVVGLLAAAALIGAVLYTSGITLAMPSPTPAPPPAVCVAT